MKVLIIGAGPSLKRNLKELKENYLSLNSIEMPKIFCTDKALKPTLDAGINVDYAATYEVITHMVKHYTGIKKGRGDGIRGFINNATAQTVQDAMENTGMSIEFVDPKSDDTLANVGLYSTLVAIQKLGATEIYMIGMDTCCGMEDIKVPTDHQLFPLIYDMKINPHTERIDVMNPIHLLWKEEFLREYEHYPNVIFTNLTGNGTLYDDNIKWSGTEHEPRHMIVTGEISKEREEQIKEIAQVAEDEYELGKLNVEKLFSGEALKQKLLFVRRSQLSHKWRSLKQLGLV